MSLVYFILILYCACEVITASWTKEASMVFNRSDFVAVSDANAMYVCGGCSMDQPVYDDSVVNSLIGSGKCPQISDYCAKYNFKSKTWTNMRQSPRPRYRESAVINNGFIYYAFGRGLDDSILPYVDVYNIFADTWSTLPSQTNFNGLVFSSDATMWSYGDMIYITGGYGQSYNVFNTTVGLNVKDLTPTFRLGLIPDKPTRTGDLSSSVYGKRAFIYGGFTDENNWTAPVKSLEVLNMETLKWSILASMNYGRGDFATALIGSFIFVAGGQTYDELGNTLSVENVEYYDINANKWTTFGPIAYPRFRFSGAVHGTDFHDIGGQQSSFVNKSGTLYYPVLGLNYALTVADVIGAANFLSLQIVGVLCLVVAFL